MTRVDFMAHEDMLYIGIYKFIIKRTDSRARVTEDVLYTFGFETFYHCFRYGHFICQT